jgi:hypothetical protein
MSKSITAVFDRGDVHGGLVAHGEANRVAMPRKLGKGRRHPEDLAGGSGRLCGMSDLR